MKRVCIRVDGAWQKEGLLGAFVWMAENLQVAEHMQGSRKQVILRANVAEATACLEAIRWCHAQGITKATILTDSLLLTY